MKLSGRTLKQRLYGLGRLPQRLARVRYFRGHGVHSPYVYAIVRQVFMPRELKPGREDLYQELLALGAPRRRAVQLQNLMIHCGYEHYAINSPKPETQLLILTSELEVAITRSLVEEAAAHKRTVVLARPYDCRERMELCRALVEQHSSTSVDNRGYLILFNNHLPKQHFCL